MLITEWFTQPAHLLDGALQVKSEADADSLAAKAGGGGGGGGERGFGPRMKGACWLTQ